MAIAWVTKISHVLEARSGHMLCQLSGTKREGPQENAFGTHALSRLTLAILIILFRHQKSLMDVYDILYFFLLGRGGGGGPKRWGGGIGFVLKIQRRGGFQEGGRGAGRVSVANWGNLGGGG